MRTVKTIAVSLEPEYVELLERLARREGSRSAAVRRLLREHEDLEREEAYREYYADPRNAKADRELTEAMLSIASFPEEWYVRRSGRGRRKSQAR